MTGRRYRVQRTVRDFNEGDKGAAGSIIILDTWDDNLARNRDELLARWWSTALIFVTILITGRHAS
ncbi:MAG: hypothetical protein JO227_18950 [Acetobacteraceae bacterium]|nr:hypothetical protein [Acetobacteraceae bacterium]